MYYFLALTAHGGLTIAWESRLRASICDICIFFKLKTGDEFDKYKPSATYIPNAAVLHRCGDWSGCCQRPDDTCVSIESELVTFVFRRIWRGERLNLDIPLVNHTLCACRSLNSVERSQSRGRNKIKNRLDNLLLKM